MADPAPALSIGCLTWHLGFWWTTTLGCCFGSGAPAREEITWPGSAALPWGQHQALAHIAGWANVELTKKVAEIGLVRHLHEAGGAGRFTAGSRLAGGRG